MEISINKRLFFYGGALFLTLLAFGVVSVYGFLVHDDWFFFSPVTILLAGLGLLVFAGLSVLLYMGKQETVTHDSTAIEEINLVEETDQFAWLYRNSPVPYLTINAGGTITLSNLAALRLFERSEAELQTLHISDLLFSLDEDDFSVVLGRLTSGDTINETEMEVIMPDERRKWVLLSVFSYDNSGDRLVSLVDITKQKQVETAKTEFVSLASHQLRTPVAAIRWNLELLGAEHVGGLNELQQKYYQKVHANVLRMNALIGDFLNVSKLELGTFATDRTAINLTNFCDEILDEFQDKITTKQLTISREYQSSDFIFNSDTRLMHIIVSNLVSNAVKYTPASGSVTLRFVADANTLTITVADTGIGVPETEVEQLFSKFYRATNAREQETEGTGLGLYIVKQSAEILGGSITVRSVANEGTTFVVSLPMK